MNTSILRQSPWSASILELLERQRVLAVYGLVCLALAAVALTLQIVDLRTLASGVNVWVKPAKFFASVGLLALTAAWFTGYVNAERRRSWPVRITVALVVLPGTFELSWISWQAAQGLESHFNFDTPFYQTMYNLMGMFALLLVASTLPIAWQVARHPAQGLSRDFVAAVVIGLVLTCLLGGAFGAAIAANGGHSVGSVGGAVPLFGWNRSGGDLRIAHFLGIHAEQALPMLSALTAGYGALSRTAILAVGIAAYLAVSTAVFVQAQAGAPLI